MRPALPCSLLVAGLATFLAGSSRAGPLVEWFLWNEMGNQVGNAIASHSEYRAERELWKRKVAAAQAELERCGGCASARAELAKWQKIENDFQVAAGNAAATVGMPPALAEFLDIDMPMAPAPTAAELAERKRVVRPAWADARPAYCQAAVDRHITCLRRVREESWLGWDEAEGFGGRCFDTKKLYDHCAAGDYESFQNEQKLQKDRAAGITIAETSYSDFYRRNYYGLVPNSFVPDYPPQAEVLGFLERPKARSISYYFFKEDPGHLGGFLFKYFDHRGTAAGMTCSSVDRDRNDEIGNRTCNDMWELTTRRDSPILVCLYTRGGGAHEQLESSVFWYKRRPAMGDPKYMLERAAAHPLLLLGEPRTECPATLEAAHQAESQYVAKLEQLQQTVAMIPASTILPRHESQIERQQAADSEFERQQEVRAAMSSFEFGGDYRLALAMGDQERSGTCSITVKSPVQIVFSCIIDGTNVSAEGIAAGGELIVTWPAGVFESPINTNLFVDLDYREQQGGDALAVKGGDGSVSGHLIRSAGLKAFSLDALPGTYAFEMSIGGVSRTGACTVKRKEFFKDPPRYSFVWQTDDGARYESEAQFRGDDMSTLWLAGWSPGWFTVNGTDILDLHLKAEDGGQSSVLRGNANDGATAVLTRIDPAVVAGKFGTPLEDLPELSRGKYAQAARARGVDSLEELAVLSDEQAQAIGMGWVWRRDLAREYLARQGARSSP